MNKKIIIGIILGAIVIISIFLYPNLNVEMEQVLLQIYTYL